MEPIANEEDVKYYLGRFYFENKNYKEAIKIYKAGLTITPKSVILLYEIGLEYSKLKNHKKALRFWRKLLKIVPYSLLTVKVRGDLGKEKIPNVSF